MSQPVVFQQRAQVRQALRTQLPLAVLLALLTWVIAAIALSAAGAPRPVGWAGSVLLAAGVTALVLWLRSRQVRGNAVGGTLRVEDGGLVADYGGTTRTLAWGAIEQLGPIAHPASVVANNTSIAGAVLTSAATAAGRVAAPRTLGVLGPGAWVAGEGAQVGARKLMHDFYAHQGAYPDGRARVAIWFDDYEHPEQVQQLVLQHRPDLAGGASAAG